MDVYFGFDMGFDLVGAGRTAIDSMVRESFVHPSREPGAFEVEQEYSVAVSLASYQISYSSLKKTRLGRNLTLRIMPVGH